jgi:ribosomal RNA-processing protein 1
MNASFAFLSRNKWKKSLVLQWNAVVEEIPLECKDLKIPNGLRYHVMDVWVDEMDKVGGDEWEKEERKETLEMLVLPVEKMAKEGKLKPLREAAKECLADERLRAWRGLEDEVMQEEEDDDEEVEWGGFD